MSPLSSSSSSLVVEAIPLALVAPSCFSLMPDAREQVADLAHRVHGQPGVLDLLEVGVAGRRCREVAPALAAVEASGLAVERSRDHPAHGVLAGHHLASGLARRQQPGLGEDVHVRGELEHRVRRGVEDQLAGRKVVLAEVLDHLGAAVGAVAAEAQAGGLLEPLDHIGWEALRIGRERVLGHHAHQLPVAGGGFLSRPERMKASVDHRIRCRRHALDGDDRAEPEPLERRQLESPDPLGEVPERVRARVAVSISVRQRAHSAGIQDDDGRTRHCAAIMSMRGFAILKG